MTAAIVLCADAASLRHPDLLGLAGENLAGQKWLRVFSSGEEARRCLRHDRGVVEAWVTSADDVEPINLAAALKRDRADMRVCLVAFEGTGSLMSRANAASVDVSLTRQAFVARYADAKQRLTGGLASPGQDAVARQYPDTVVRPDAVRGATGQATPAGRSAFLLPVVSGSGGAGKSTVAALSALLAQGLGYRTLLLDLDLQFGDMRDLMGLPQAIGIDEMLATPARISQLEPSDSLPALLAAPRHLEDAEAIVRDVPRLLDEVRSRFDVVIVNTGAAWGEQHALLLERSSKVLFLVDQRLSSLRACQHALDLCTRCGIATGPFLFAANRCAKGSLLTSIDVSCALRGSHAVELREGGREVEELMASGQPLELASTGNELCESLERVLVDMLPEGESRVSRKESLQGGRVERMFGRGRRRSKRGASCRC